MEASPHFLSEAAFNPDRFAVWTEEVEDIPIHGRRIPEYRIAMDGLYLGVLHWETDADQQEGFIDGIDSANGAETVELGSNEWEALAIYMHGITKVRRITYYDGSEEVQRPFLEAI